MMKKTITYLLLISLIYTINLKTVNAYTISIPSFGEEEGETEGDDWIKGETFDGDTSEEGSTIYQCYYKTNISVVNDITANGYNPDNEPIIENSLNIKEEDRIVAGTSLGISLIETKTISWSVSAKIETELHLKIKKYDYNCHYKPKRQPVLIPINPYGPIVSQSILTFSKIQSIAIRCGNIRQDTLPCDINRQPNPSECEYDGYTPILVGEEETTLTKYACLTTECREYLKQCQDEAATKAAAMATAAANATSVEIEFPDSNDVNGTEKVKITSAGCTGDCIFTAESGQASGSGTAIFNYKMEKACINIKNSKVSYKSEPCSDEEIEIKNDITPGKEHWHYFIPLNAKSDKPIDINVIPSGDEGILNPRECLAIMTNERYGLDKETSYVDLIIKKNGENFEGIERLDKQEAEENGCQITAKIKIYPKQKFYNEEENDEGNNIFKGFNFYYKPIDIENPFPNGLTGESLWKEWNDKYTSTGDENPKITDSFDERNLTYIAHNINAKKIRDYNKDNAYTNWSNMMINGRSKFIENEGIISRNTSTTFYKLGCGPFNADWSECR